MDNKHDEKQTIWLVNHSGHDYSPALRVVPGDAELSSLSIGNVNVLNVDRLADSLSEGIVRYTRPEDYLLFSGAPVLNALSMTIWLMHHGKVRTLNWDAKRRTYKLVEVTADNLSRLQEKYLT